jgi:hypothetical protein
MRADPRKFALAVGVFLAAGGGAHADGPSPTSPGADLSPAALDARLRRIETEQAEKIAKLEAANARLQESLEKLNEQAQLTQQRVDELAPHVNKFTGYMDFGFFYAGGDGSGIRPDTGHQHFPEYDGVVPDGWVFYGDPLATTVNSRGEPADTQTSRAVTLNSIKSNGKASFILNSLTIGVFFGLADNLTFTGAVDFLARSRNVSDPDGVGLGDFIDVKLAYLEYRVPIKSFGLSLFAGKVDSVLGIEYRTQDAPDRIGVTPSLICRYTCGRPLGIKARLRYGKDLFVAALAVTNGSSFSEYFPFYDETDTNFFKTFSARLSTKIPIGAGLELGASGLFGAQDNQASDTVFNWQYGFDLHFQIRDFILMGEFLQGNMPGKTDPGDVSCGVAPCIRFMGAYGLVAYRVLNWLTPYARVDWRDALHQSGASFVYISDLVRVTGGLHFELGTHVLIKGEFTYVRQLGRAPQFDSNVLTTSLVVKY